MTAQPLARFLVDFARGPTPARTAPCDSTPAVEAASDVLARHQAELHAARTAGREEGRAEKRQEVERMLAKMRDDADARLAAERAAWVRDQGEALADMLTRAFATIEQRVAEQVAAILGDFVVETVRERMIGELASHLHGLLASERHVLRIAAPDDLIDVLRRRLPDHASIEFVVSSGPDIHVMAGDACVETRLSAWRDLVRAEPV